MALRLTISSRHGQPLGTGRVKKFGPRGGTIGRSPDCTWSLPDSKRFLSSRHASIDFRSGSYYIIDTSKNGVYVNGADQPVGRGKPQRLFNGDALRIGDYRITVEIDEDPIAPLLDEHHVDPVDRAQRVEAPEPAGKDMVQAFEITGVGVEMMMTDEVLETLSSPPTSRGAYLEIVADGTPARAPAAAPNAPAATTPRAAAATPSAPTPSASPKAARPPQGGADLLPFFRGARLAAEVPPQQTDAFLFRLGQVMRTMVLGVTENLHLQGEQKNALRVSDSAPLQQIGNPLRRASGPDEALISLLLRDTAVTPVESVRAAFEELQLHQRVLLKAMRTALDAFLSRLDPEELEQKLARGRVSALLGAANRLKCWDHYKELYEVVAHHPPDELPMQFLDDLADAYRRELADARDLATPVEEGRHAS